MWRDTSNNVIIVNTGYRLINGTISHNYSISYNYNIYIYYIWY